MPTFQKSWEDKRKFKMDQRKKGTKPTFLRNNTQGQPTSRETRMIIRPHLTKPKKICKFKLLRLFLRINNK
jgi:hypothetical protein